MASEEFPVDRSSVRETYVVICVTIIVVVCSNVLVHSLPQLAEMRLVVLAVSMLFMLCLLLMVPNLYEGRFQKLTIGDDSLRLERTKGNAVEVRFTDLVEVVWNGWHGRGHFSTSIKRLVIPFSAFERQHRLRIIQLLRARVPFCVQSDWPRFCRNTAVPLFFHLTGRDCVGNEIPVREPQTKPKFERVHVTRRESIGETVKACRFVNKFMLALVALVGVQSLIELNPFNNGLDWPRFLGSLILLAVAVSAIVWAIGGVFCLLTPKAGRKIKRRLPVETEDGDGRQSNMSGSEILPLFVVCSTTASLCTWFFYIGCCDGIGFSRKETALASIAVFLLIYVGSAVVISLHFNGSLAEKNALEIWGNEAANASVTN